MRQPEEWNDPMPPSKRDWVKWVIVVAVLVLLVGACLAAIGAASDKLGTNTDRIIPSASMVACTVPQWSTQAVATAAWADVPGRSGAERWLAGDGGWTVVHPATCARLHIFGDSAVLNGAGAHVMPHGNAVLQHAPGIPGPELQLITGARSMIPDSQDGSIDWPGPTVLEGNRLFTFTSHVSTTGTGWTDKGKDLAEFGWAGGNVIKYQGKWVTPSTGRAGQQKQADGSYQYSIAWGASIVRIGGWYYIYGTYSEQGWFGNRVYLASVPVGQLTNAAAWRYRTQNGWSLKESDARPVVSEFGGPESAFSTYDRDGTVKIVSKKDGTFGSDVTRWSSAYVTGPWVTTRLFSAPWTETDQTYLVMAHGDMRYTDGRMPVTISHGRGSSGSLDEMYTNPARYRNSWHSVAP